jgi:hypothetical protein
MARIQINELPVETLTPQEMEEIFGAGRCSFHPTFEALEARELMASNLLGSALPPIQAPAHTTGHAVTFDLGKPLSSHERLGISLGSAQGRAQHNAFEIKAEFEAKFANDPVLPIGKTTLVDFRWNANGEVTMVGLKLEFPRGSKIPEALLHMYFDYHHETDTRDWVKCSDTWVKWDWDTGGRQYLQNMAKERMDHVEVTPFLGERSGVPGVARRQAEPMQVIPTMQSAPQLRKDAAQLASYFAAQAKPMVATPNTAAKPSDPFMVGSL